MRSVCCRMCSIKPDDEIIPEMSTGSYDTDRGLNDCKNRHNSYVSKSHFAFNGHPFNHEGNKKVKHHYLPNHYNRKEIYDFVLSVFPLVVLVKTLGKLKENASGRLVQVVKRFVARADGMVFEENVVLVMTAWHVCKNQGPDGFQIECILDYDTKEIQGTALKATRIHYKDEIRDFCVLECPISDKAMAKMLTKRVVDFERVFRKLYERMKRKKKPFGKWFTSEWTTSKLVIIISHPHGGPKKISVGERTWRDPYDQKKGRYCLSYCYTANTCCGCSGAPVIVFGAPTYNILLVHRGKRLSDNTNSSSQAFRLKKNRHGPFSFQVWMNAE